MSSQNILDAIDVLLSKDIPEDVFAELVIAQACLFAGLNADEFGGLDSD